MVGMLSEYAIILTKVHDHLLFVPSALCLDVIVRVTIEMVQLHLLGQLMDCRKNSSND